MGGCVCSKKTIVIQPSRIPSSSLNHEDTKPYSTSKEKITDKPDISISKQIKQVEDHDHYYKHDEYIKKRINRFYCIDVKPWIIILDFLPKKDLYSVGKVNRSLNTISKSKDILTKFFRNNKIQDKKIKDMLMKQDSSQAAITNLEKIFHANSNTKKSMSVHENCNDNYTENKQIIIEKNHYVKDNNINNLKNQNNSNDLLNDYNNFNCNSTNTKTIFKEIKIISMDINKFDIENILRKNSNKSINSANSPIPSSGRDLSVDFSLNSHTLLRSSLSNNFNLHNKELALATLENECEVINSTIFNGTSRKEREISPVSNYINLAITNNENNQTMVNNELRRSINSTNNNSNNNVNNINHNKANSKANNKSYSNRSTNKDANINNSNAIINNNNTNTNTNAVLNPNTNTNTINNKPPTLIQKTNYYTYNNYYINK